MSRLVDALIDRRRLWIVGALLLTLVGVAAWFTMPRAEDPRLPERNGNLVVTFPGADASTIERLVLGPIEDELAEVAQVDTVESTARADVAILRIELGGNVYDTDVAWDAVREALDEARIELPAGVGAFDLDHHFSDAEAVIVRIEGSDDPVVLHDAAERVGDALLAVPGAARIERAGVAGTQVTVHLDASTARRIGLSPAALARQLEGRNQTLPGGAVRVDGRTVVVRPLTEQTRVEGLRRTPILLPSGSAIPLGELATVRLEAEHPLREIVRHNGRSAVTVSLVPRPDLDLVLLGERAEKTLESLRTELSPLEITVFADQPENVKARLADLGWSLILGILIVAGVLFVAMGARLGLVVASVVPLVTFTTVALYAAGGGVLHQLSIAALVIALGLLVDNAIVVAEAVQARRDRGEGPWQAASGAVGELAIPLATATGTTLAAFVPMLLSGGVTGDFTRAIPVVIMAALTISYFFAVLVTPVLAGWMLRPRPAGRDGLAHLGERLAAVATGRPWWTLGGVGAVLMLTASLGGLVQSEFFPYADRARFVTTVQLPEGADLHETLRVAEQIESWARSQDAVVDIDTFVGRSAPRFYYNVPSVPFAPHFAQVVLSTRSPADVPGLVESVRAFGRDRVPDALVTARRLQQGPPSGAPVEIRLTGHDLDDLLRAAESVSDVLYNTPGSTAVRHDLGLGQPTLEVAVDDAAAARRGLARTDVALALLAQTRGLDSAPYRGGDTSVPVLVRSADGIDTSPVLLASADVGALGTPVPLQAIATPSLRWTPSALSHRNRARVVTVASELSGGVTASTVLAAAGPALRDLTLPDGVTLALGGESEASGEANSALLGALPLGMLLLLGCLLLEFNSFRRVGLVLVTVPLAAAGVLPGLVLAGQPFGFMSLLGVIALVGIVVNNAIVLLDVVDHGLEHDLPLDQAITEAVRARVRPILLTTGTTVAGLLPLAFSSSTLWPPLASAMVSGLLASTVLTLLAVPALTHLVLRPRRTA